MTIARIGTLACLILIAPLIVHGQQRSVSLLVSECGSVRGVCQYDKLVRFRFRNGVLMSKDLILSTDISLARYDLGKNHVYRNRYVITNWGDIVDIRNKRLLHDGQGKFVAAEGDRVIQHVAGINVEGYFYYDLKTDQYRRLLGPTKWALPGVLSPDQSKSVEGGSDNIWLHSLIQNKKLLGSGFFIQQAMEASFMPKAPVFWLDNTRVLSQRNNGEIVVVQLDGTVTPIVKFPVTGPNYTDPYFFRDRDDRIIYVCSGQSFVINVEEKSYTPHEWITLGSGFYAETKVNPSYGHVIRYEENEIGRLWASVWRAPATDGYVAFEYGEVGSNLGYPKGIQVWSTANGKWTVIDTKRVSRIIGWVTE
jgi:hypothetical protein